MILLNWLTYSAHDNESTDNRGVILPHPHLRPSSNSCFEIDMGLVGSTSLSDEISRRDPAQHRPRIIHLIDR